MSLREARKLATEIDKAEKVKIAQRLANGEIDQEEHDILMRDARLKRLSPKTINRHLRFIGKIFTWQKVRKEGEDFKPIEGLTYSRKSIEKADRKKKKDERVGFDVETLRRILRSPIWTGCKSLGRRNTKGSNVFKDSLYWAFLIGLLAGLRIEEIAQFEINDAREVLGVWCFDINYGPDKSLKTGAAERLVPIHQLLIQLGLLDRVERLRKEGKRRLFPELTRDKNHGKYGDSLTDKFSYYLDAIGEHTYGCVYHACRHTFDTLLQNLKVPTPWIAQMMGHEQQGETNGRYNDGIYLRNLRDAVNGIDLGLQLVPVDGEWQIAGEAE